MKQPMSWELDDVVYNERSLWRRVILKDGSDWILNGEHDEKWTRNPAANQDVVVDETAADLYDVVDKAGEIQVFVKEGDFEG